MTEDRAAVVKRLKRMKATTKTWASPGGREFVYPVTESQHEAADAVMSILMGTHYDRSEHGFFCSQMPDGTLVMGANHRSVNIDRRGRVRANRSTR